jgi:hypothetical protein
MRNLMTRIYTGTIFNLIVVSTVLADNCSSPGDCLQTAGYNAMVAIIGGSLGIVAALFGSRLAEIITRERLEEPIPMGLEDAIQDQRGRVRYETVKHIKDVTEEVLSERGREMVVTSEYRNNSAAHKRGAIDISSKDLSGEDRHEEARVISERLGQGYTVVVEEIIDNKDQLNTSYREGAQLNQHTDKITASATHTHIQW